MGKEAKLPFCVIPQLRDSIWDLTESKWNPECQSKFFRFLGGAQLLEASLIPPKVCLSKKLESRAGTRTLAR